MLDLQTNRSLQLTDDDQWERLSSFFDDLPAWKATDWAVGYLPAFEKDLGLSLDRPELNRGRLILDHGCGKGEPSRFMENHLQVGGIGAVDSSRTMIERARERGGQRISYVHLDEPATLPFPSGIFDGAVSFFVFLTMSDPQQQLRIARELHRVMANGAPLVLLANNPQTIGNRFASVQVGNASDQLFPGSPVRLRLFELGSVTPFLEAWDVFWPTEHYVALLEAAGFRNVHAEPRQLDRRYEAWLTDMGVHPDDLALERLLAPLVSIVGYR
jgi:SAM-dependent methyltransferase